MDSVPDGSLTPSLVSTAVFDSLPIDAASALETYKQRDTKDKGEQRLEREYRQGGKLVVPSLIRVVVCSLSRRSVQSNRFATVWINSEAHEIELILSS